MFINLFYSPHDTVIATHRILSHPNVISKPIRELIHIGHSNHAVILISANNSNQKLINIIRKFNILTPIFILSQNELLPFGSNGHINNTDLSFNVLMQRINNFPQRKVWPYAFKVDAQKRLLINPIIA